MLKFGQSGAGRTEDHRFLTGTGRYVDDIAPKGALHALFFRATAAHADITALDVSAARAAPGVHLVLTADDLLAAGVLLGMKGEQVPNADGSKGAAPERPVLAHGRIRFVGEAVAMVVADTLEDARDALELIELDTRDLPVAMALAAGDDTIHPEAPRNLAFNFAFGDDAAVETALAGSAHRVPLRIMHNRIIVNSMEPRAAFAEWADDRLHLCVNGQGVWVQKSELARMMKLDDAAVRVTNPDVGGGFGMKGMTYPEYVVLAAAAKALGRPVRWMSERTEAMLTDNGGRDLLADVELGFDADYKITAYRANLVSNLGAYNSQFAQFIQTVLFSKVLTGVYDIQKASLNVAGVYTNTTPVDAYRGAGRPEAILTIERVMDEAARVLRVDPFDLRQRNFIRAFPYRMVNGETVDDGDFTRVLNRLQTEADVKGYPARKAASEKRGRLRGMGLACYIEAILGADTETAAYEFAADGTVLLFVGTQSNGQGHETVFPQMLSDATGIPMDQIVMVQGDSDRIKAGGGTGGSRSVTVQGTAMRATTAQMIDAFAGFLGDEWDTQDVAFGDGTFGAAGSNLRLTMIETANLARQKGRSDLLRHTATTKLDGRSFPNGAHLAEVEIDPETGQMWLDRYTVADDFGVLINPTLAEGQVHGGVAQGLGQAMMERVVYDDQGQLLTASFMDYAMPRAQDLPMIRFFSEPTPTKTNPLGMKGCGEAGTVGSVPSVCNAVRDALADRGVHDVEMPFTPHRIWAMLQEAHADAD